MLRGLKIENFVLFEVCSLDPEDAISSRLNIISGETGAGKSLFLEALLVLSGARLRVESIQKNASYVRIQASIEATLADEGLGPIFTVERFIDISGKQKNLINQKPVSLAYLQRIMQRCIQFVRQHAAVSLGKMDMALKILDQAGGYQQLQVTVEKAFDAWQDALKACRLGQDRYKKNTIAYEHLQEQLRELQEAALEPGEEELWEERKKQLKAAYMQQAALEEAQKIVQNSTSSGIVPQLRRLLQACKACQAEGLQEMVATVLLQLEEVDFTVSKSVYLQERPEWDLVQIEERLALLFQIKRKFGPSFEEVLQKQQSLRQAYENYQHEQQDVMQLEQKVKTAWEVFSLHAQKLSEARTTAALRVSEEVSLALKALNMPSTRFEVQICADAKRPSPHGFDYPVMLLQQGAQDPLSLADIASGGELSRILLALHGLGWGGTSAKILVLDEIDAGMSGSTAFAVGKMLQKMSQHAQIFCITHLAQVACFADVHLQVKKQHLEGGITVTYMQPLRGDERIKELARILGGPHITAKALENAQELVDLI